MKCLKPVMMLSAILLASTVSIEAASMPRNARVLLAERDHLQQKLLRADQAAAEALLRGEDPIELYADQTGLQEQVDMMQMRLESLAMRLDFDLPPLSTLIEQSDPADLLDAHVAIGKHRASAAMVQRCRTACGSIMEEMSFDSFLDF